MAKVNEAGAHGLISCAFEFKADETGLIEGYGAVFGNRDQGDDVIMAGAFARSLREMKGRPVPMLMSHDRHRPIGVWDDVAEDTKGLRCRGRFAMKTPDGAATYELAKMGAITGLSIGYRTKVAEYDTDTGVRTLKDVDLKEISPVVFPMNEVATITAVKAAGQIKTIREFEEFLRDAGGFSHAAAKAIASRGFKAKSEPRDETGEAISDLLRTVRDARAAIR